ncbi:probable RNA polymerase II nuclear localization protein SLC7A6OS [Antennarius striatus]|uniref:probable RNA polymerase II nuclear localization protein SLC7A6OS n=1 Tax=Antennarius striatus TaxID=241820 RepID=UPI0035AF8EC2
MADMEPNATVLRVKRKRGSDPADALLLACKRIRPEAPGSPVPEPDVERSLFKLVATVDTQDAPVKTHVQEALTRPQLAHALRPSAASAQRIVGDLRSSKWSTRREERYRIVSGHRPGLLEPAEGLHPQTDTPDGGQQADEETDKCLSLGNIQVVDLLHETEEDQKISAGEVASDPEVILCNNIQMLRERLNISGGGPDEEQDADYVYDLYCQETAAQGWIQDILSVSAYADDGQLVPDLVVQEEEVYDDEDDENDEANWRNDYPDEEGSESEAEQRYVGHWDEEEEEHSYSCRSWRRYRRDVIQEVGVCSEEEGDDCDSD